MKTGELRCTEMLTGALANLAETAGDDGVAASDFEQLDRGVAATLHHPSGDRYRVSVEWLGDQEAE